MADRKLMAVLESGSEWMGALNDQVKELRSRLQALEQNTVPSGSAKQKLYSVSYPCGCGAAGPTPLPNYCSTHGVAKQKPREWFMKPGPHDRADYCEAHPTTESLARAGYIRVREVLDD